VFQTNSREVEALVPDVVAELGDRFRRTLVRLKHWFKWGIQTPRDRFRRTLVRLKPRQHHEPLNMRLVSDELS